MEKKLKKATELFDKYRIQESKQILDAILSDDDTNISALLLLGKLNMRTQQYGDAINCFNKVLTILPENKEAKTSLNLIRGILQLVNNFYFENPYTDEDLYELSPYNEVK